MFNAWFPQNMTTLRKLIWLRKINGGGGGDPLNTFTGAIVRFLAKKAKPIVKLEANFTPIQSGTGDPSPTNIRPISGHTGCDIFDKAEYDAQATPTVSINFGTTVYGGTLTIKEDGSGQVVATHKYYENAGTGTWGEVTTGGARYYIGGVSSDSKGDSPNGWCNIGKLVSNFPSDGVVVGSNGRINLCGSLHDAFASTDALKTYLASNPLQVVYELATPITIPLTPGQINTLVGENNVWVNDAPGDITVQAYGTEIT